MGDRILFFDTRHDGEDKQENDRYIKQVNLVDFSSLRHEAVFKREIDKSRYKQEISDIIRLPIVLIDMIISYCCASPVRIPTLCTQPSACRGGAEISAENPANLNKNKQGSKNVGDNKKEETQNHQSIISLAGIAGERKELKATLEKDQSSGEPLIIPVKNPKEESKDGQKEDRKSQLIDQRISSSARITAPIASAGKILINPYQPKSLEDVRGKYYSKINRFCFLKTPIQPQGMMNGQKNNVVSGSKTNINSF